MIDYFSSYLMLYKYSELKSLHHYEMILYSIDVCLNFPVFI
jgi:hypothetical protein